MRSFQKEIQAVASEIARIHKIERHLERLKKNKATLQKEFKRIESILKNEKRDVDILESSTMTALFYKILGSKTKQLEIERQEYLMVALKYNEILDKLGLVDYEIDILSKKYQILPQLQLKLDKLLKQKELEIRVVDKQFSRRLTLLDDRMSEYHHTWVDLEEAIKAGIEARTILKSLKQNLLNVNEWGAWGSYGSGLHSRYNRKGWIDRARKKAIMADQKLAKFENEVGDVYKGSRIRNSFDLDSFDVFLNVFYENLITDWIVKLKIKSALHSVISVIDHVNRFLQILRAEKLKIIKGLKKLEAERQNIIHNA